MDKTLQHYSLDELASIYYKSMSFDQGAPSVDARIVIGAMVIKHKLKLDDREVVETIRENVYLQYFLGLSAYTVEPLFDRSLFTTFRYRLGPDKFDQMSQRIIAKALDLSAVQTKEEERDPPDDQGHSDTDAINEKQAEKPEQKSPAPKGKLKIDATVADQLIKYPTDLDLLSDSREQSERMIDQLSALLKLTKKPRTYRRNARRDYLNIIKKKRKNKKELHRAIGKQLNYLKRDLATIDRLLDSCTRVPFTKRDYKIYLVIQHIYAQQLQMYRDKSHSHSDRIVNIYQPHVRAIVRGKAKSMIEFGAKLGVSEHDGYVRINTLSWNAYNESSDLPGQAEHYRQLHGRYPEVVIADTIYGTRENRQWLKDKGIRYSGKALGRPKKTTQTPYQKRKFKKEQGERNHIEGKFGQGKNGYNLNKIRARTALTSQSWIACILFVMNLVKFSKNFSAAQCSALFTSINTLLYQRMLNIETKITMMTNPCIIRPIQNYLP